MCAVGWEEVCLCVCMCACMCPGSVGMNNGVYVLFLALQFEVVYCDDVQLRHAGMH